MDISITSLATAQFAVEMLVATFIAMAIWHNIPPKTMWANAQAFVEDFVAKFVAVFGAALVIVTAGTDIYAIGGFISIVGAGVTGVGVASWALQKTNLIAPPSSPGPPVA